MISLFKKKIRERNDKKSGKRGSNSRPPAWEASALPTELLPQKIKEPIPGLEPGTYALRMRCSTN